MSKVKSGLGYSLLASCLAAAAPASAANRADVQRIVGNPDDLSVPGCAAGVFRDGKIAFTAAAGSADIGAHKPLNSDSLLYAGSVSKQFTALAIATLVQQGKIGLDDEVQKWVPELPRYAAPVTIHMLLNHISGVRDSLELMKLAGVPSPATSNMRAALNLLYLQKAANFTPGTRFSYSNGGYLLLADIVERATRMPFTDYMRRAILEPLGMNHSFFISSPPLPGLIVHGYMKRDAGFAVLDNFPSFSGSGGLITSINDMAKYDHDINVGHKVWTPAVTRIMLTPGRFTNGAPAVGYEPDMTYASGVMVGRKAGQNEVRHSGSSDTFKAGYVRLPDQKLGVMLLCNRSDALPMKLADRIVDAVASGRLHTAESQTPEVPAQQSPFRKTPRMPAEGRYRSAELNAIYDLKVQGDSVTATIVSNWAGHPHPYLTSSFTRRADGVLRSEDTAMIADADGRGFSLQTGRIESLHFERLPLRD